MGNQLRTNGGLKIVDGCFEDFALLLIGEQRLLGFLDCQLVGI